MNISIIIYKADICINYVKYIFSFFIVTETKPTWAKRMVMTGPKVLPLGGVFELKCPAEGNPTPRITWLKNGLPFTKRDYGTVCAGLNRKG